MDYVLLTSDPLEISKINDLVAHESCGAISYFVGTTRDKFDSKQVLSLEYEAYEPMALKEMHAICKELRARWSDIVNIAIYHRLGLVKVREASVIIAISSPHRQTALDATAEAIEELKRRVPIWKKEIYCNNESAWKENKESTGQKEILDFKSCPILNVNNIETDFVQISAPETEIERRIESFVKKKREEIDLSNKLDFICKPKATDNAEEITSCARLDSILVKQENSSKGHLRVRHAARVNFGPQIRRPDYLQAIDKHMNKSKLSNQALKTAKVDLLNERAQTIESFLGLSNISSQTVHQRLKAIEDRILFLETMSPEYKHFLDGPSNEFPKELDEPITSTELKPFSNVPHRKTYSIAQLDAIISDFEKDE